MRLIILTKGIPASGKTSWALDEMNKHRGVYKRFNKDEMRTLLDANYGSPENEDFIFKLRNEGVEMALIKGYDVIIDDTNFNEKNFLAMCEIAERIGDVRVFEKFFEVTLKEALQRNVRRRHPIPEHIIESMFKKHIKNSRVEIRDEYFPPSKRNTQLPKVRHRPPRPMR